MQVYWKARCAAHLGAAATDAGLLAPAAITLDRPVLTYDGVDLAEGRMRVAEADLRFFWGDFIATIDRLRGEDGASCTGIAAALRGKLSAAQLETCEVITTRLSWRLAAVLQPLVFDASQGSLGLGSFWDLSLLCHHIILGGEEASTAACTRHFPPGFAFTRRVLCCRPTPPRCHSRQRPSPTRCRSRRMARGAPSVRLPASPSSRG